MNTPAGPQDAVATREMPSISAGDTAPMPPAPSLVTPSGDACPGCGSPMTADQRYCIECGERRGDSRLTSLEQAASAQPYPAAPTAPAAYSPPPAAPRGRSQGLALIATIGLLLLAMGVGVLIGNKGGDPNSAVAQQPIVIGAAGPSAATGATTATAAASGSGKDGGSDSSSDASTANADAVAKKNGVKLAPKDAKIGDKCDKGAVGCDGGEFTGDYFK